jgi:hypothetical protein
MKKLKDILKESNIQMGKVYSNPYATAFVKENEEERKKEIELSDEQKQAFLEAVKQYKKYGEAVYRNAGLGEVYESIKNMVEVAGKMTISETGDWFDNVTVSRHMKRMGESFNVFEKTLKEVSTLQQRLEASYDEIGEVLGKYYEISEELDPVGKEDGDIDNDGDEDASDEYLANRRKVISKAMKNESVNKSKSVVNEAKYDIGMARLGNGITVYNRAVEYRGDYKNIAHISDNGTVTYYDKSLPSDVKKKIEAEAQKMKESVNEAKHDFMARFGRANINLKKGYKHHDEDELYDLYDKLGKLVKTLKVKDVTLVFESVNEVASRTAMEIGGLTGMSKDAIQKFVDDNNLDIEKVFQFVKKGKLAQRMDLVTAIAGKPGNPIQKKMIKMFGESVNENKEVVLSNQILDFLQKRKLITGVNAQKIHKELTAFLRNKAESVNEAASIYKDWDEFVNPHYILVTLKNGKKLKIEKKNVKGGTNVYHAILKAFNDNNYEITNKLVSGMLDRLGESVNESKKVTKQMWAKMNYDERVDALLTVFKDPDDAKEYADSEWNKLPSRAVSGMTIFESKSMKLTDMIKKPSVN